MTFLLGLWANPLVRRIIIYAAIAAAVLYALRWYGNRQFYQGKEEGRVAATAEIEKAKRAEWKAEQDKIDTDRLAVTAERGELARSRAAQQDTLSRSLNEIRINSRINDTKIDTIPASELDDALRAQSAKLAASK